MSGTTTHPSLVERLARHLATGSTAGWAERVEEAASILAVLKEPDRAMAQAGDAATWRMMIDAALTERWSIGEALRQPSSGNSDAGSDEEGEIALPPEHVDCGDRDSAAWIHTRHKRGE